MKENIQTILADIYMLATDKIETEQRQGYYRDILNLNNSKYNKDLELFRTQDGIHVPNPQHLYATTDEEIKQGDWYLSKSIGGYYQAVAFPLALKDAKKIVATTNPELWNMMNTSYTTVEPHFAPAKIDTTFLQPYVDAYNSGKRIEQVRLEQEYIITNEDFSKRPVQLDGYLQLKLKPNGSVVIHPVVEKMYSREEVEEMMDILNNNIDSSYNIFKWFNETYPK